MAVRDEQSANAQQLVEAGAAIMVPESQMHVESLSAQIAAVLGNPDGAVKMAQAALACGKPDATQTLVDLTLDLAKK